MSESLTAPRTVAELIEAFGRDQPKARGGNAAYARAIGISPSAAGEQKRSGSIPVEYWDLVIAAASAAGVSGVTYETLAKMHPRRSLASAEVRP